MGVSNENRHKPHTILIHNKRGPRGYWYIYLVRSSPSQAEGFPGCVSSQETGPDHNLSHYHRPPPPRLVGGGGAGGAPRGPRYEENALPEARFYAIWLHYCGGTFVVNRTYGIDIKLETSRILVPILGPLFTMVLRGIVQKEKKQALGLGRTTTVSQNVMFGSKG